MIELIEVLAETAVYLLFGLFICVALLPKEYRGKIVDMFRYRFTKIEFEDEGQEGFTVKGYIKNGMVEGVVEVRDKNKQLRCMAHSRRNMHHGNYCSWHENGHKQVEATYSNDKLHGPYKEWDELGRLMAKGCYVDDEKHGQFYEDGGIKDGDIWADHDNEYMEHVLYNHGIWINSTTWYDNGNQRYYGDKNISIQWHENGIKAEKWSQKNAQIIQEWYENGQVKFKRNDRPDGKKTWWYENGQKSGEGNYKDDKLEGKWTSWYENGQIEFEGNVKDRKPDGKWTYWHTNGQKWSERNYKNGKKNGLCQQWGDQGHLMLQGHYIDGKEQGLFIENEDEDDHYYDCVTYNLGSFISNTRLDDDDHLWSYFDDGTHITWHANGQTSSLHLIDDHYIEWYENGQIKSIVDQQDASWRQNGLYTCWYENGKIKQRGRYFDGEIDGLVCYWSEDGTEDFCKYFDKGEPQFGEIMWHENGKLRWIWIEGRSTRWHENGRKSHHQFEIHGEPHGVSRDWYENGQTKAEVSYINGLRDGCCVWWYENGQMMGKDNYLNNKLNGLSTTWHENGQIKLEENYKNGSLDGKWTKWYENGQIEWEGNYKDDKEDGKVTEWDKSGNKIL